MNGREKMNALVMQLRAKQIFAHTQDDRMVAGIERNSDAEGCVDRFGRKVSVSKLEINDEVRFLEDPVYIEKENNVWAFRNHLPFVGGGGKNLSETDIEIPEFDRLLEIVTNYYLLAPIVIGNWIVPIGQHPTWSIGAVETSIMNATEKSLDEMYELLDLQSGKVAPVGKQFPTREELRAEKNEMYIELENSSNVGARLFLRYDCSESFIVGCGSESNLTVT